MQVFVPYRGIYFLYQMQDETEKTVLRLFSSPIGESTFSTKCRTNSSLPKQKFSSPIGESTFSTSRCHSINYAKMRFRPLSGNLLSLPGEKIMVRTKIETCFRPLSGNLLSLRNGRNHERKMFDVFVPYRGIYFLYMTKKEQLEINEKVFSSPIGESTFSTLAHKQHCYVTVKWFSSPIGESTFSTDRTETYLSEEVTFSSPIGESTFSTLYYTGYRTRC